MTNKPVHISESDPSLDGRLLSIGFGWSVSQNAQTFLQKIGFEKATEFDIDAMALLLDVQGKVQSLGIERDLGAGKRMGLVDGDLVFFNNLMHPTQAVWHNGADLAAGTMNDREQIFVRPFEIPQAYSSLRFFISIHHGTTRKQHFGEVAGLYIRMVDGKGREIAFFELPSGFGQGKTTLYLAEMMRENDGWHFRPTMEELDDETLVEMLRGYL